MLDSVCGILSRSTYTPNAENTALFFRALSRFDIATVRAAFDAHVTDPTRGRFVPVPADILAQIEAAGGDGRHGAEEAWALIPMTEDETVVWSVEAADAYGVCSSLLAAGDRVAARMAFKEVYQRKVAEARSRGEPVQWCVSLGSNLELRKRALAAAVLAGQMTEAHAYDICPALPAPEALLLEGPPSNLPAAAKAKQMLDELVQEKRNPEQAKDPRAWAKSLRACEKAGMVLTAAQRLLWREAIDKMPEGLMPAGFKPIPNDVLPPGMRKAGA